jgi:hypothetical protein
LKNIVTRFFFQPMASAPRCCSRSYWPPGRPQGRRGCRRGLHKTVHLARGRLCPRVEFTGKTHGAVIVSIDHQTEIPAIAEEKVVGGFWQQPHIPKWRRCLENLSRYIIRASFYQEGCST